MSLSLAMQSTCNEYYYLIGERNVVQFSEHTQDYGLVLNPIKQVHLKFLASGDSSDEENN